MANNVDPGEIACYKAFHLDPHCLHRCLFLSEGLSGGKKLEPDQTPHSTASDLGLHCLLRPVCSNTLRYYGMLST